MNRFADMADGVERRSLHRREWLRRGVLAVVATLALFGLSTSVAIADIDDAAFAGASADGSRVFFSTDEPLLGTDSDTAQDLYQRSAGTTTRISVGQINGNNSFDVTFEGASADGSRVFFTTAEPLVAADTDTSIDIYERSAGVTTQISAGQINGNGAFDATFTGASTDGSHVFFETNEKLAPTDNTDAATDIYDHSAGTTTLISAGQINGNGAFNVFFNRASADGSRVFFTTNEQLVAADTDASQEVYERFGATTTLVSTGQINGNGAFSAALVGASEDGSRAFFVTGEQLLAADTDAQTDIYERTAGATTLVSPGTASSVTFARASADGSRVFFTTFEQLLPADTDTKIDLYERSAGATTLISTGPFSGGGADNVAFRGASANGIHVFFTTTEQLLASDTDASSDIYERSGGTTTQVSAGQINGNGAFLPVFDGASDDGTIVIFHTSEKLVGSDTDSSSDIYQRSGGTTTRVSAGHINGNGAFDAIFGGVSADGSHVFFESNEFLTEDDGDISLPLQDVFERSAGDTTLISTGQPAGNVAVDPEFVDASADGARVFFRTTESLVGADTDSSVDVYQRFAGNTTLLTAGEINGSGDYSAELRGASDDGSRVFFDTFEPLVSADIDSQIDIYQRSAGATTLLSAGQINGNGGASAVFDGASTDGSRVFFETTEQLVAGDTDAFQDVYERSAGTTTLVSAGQINGNGAFNAAFAGVSTDGSRVFFTTTEQLVAADTDASQDVYERSGGITTLVSAGQINGNGAISALFVRASADGSRVFFTTTEQLVAADTDASADIYERSGVTTTQVSAGQINGNGAFSANLAGASADGSRIFFTTNEKLVAADTDSVSDIYERSAGTTTLVSAGQINGNGAVAPVFNRVSADGSRVFFMTAEQLVSDDIDAAFDIYERSGGTTTLISAGQINGNGAFAAANSGISADGSRVFFATNEQLVSADTDTSSDTYERFAGNTTLLSVGQINGNGAFDTPFDGASADGSRVFLHTSEPLVAGDTDVNRDIYERAGGATRLLSTAKSAPPAPGLSTDPDGPANNNSPMIGGSAEANSAVAIFGNATCAGAPVATGTAAQLASPGFTLPVADDTTSGFTATATDANNNTSPCSGPAVYTEDSTKPKARINAKPKSRIKTRKKRIRVSFRFSSEAGAKFRCKLDGNGFAACHPPKSFRVRPGRHAFRLTATDAAGNVSPQVRFTFRVVRKH